MALARLGKLPPVNPGATALPAGWQHNQMLGRVIANHLRQANVNAGVYPQPIANPPVDTQALVDYMRGQSLGAF